MKKLTCTSLFLIFFARDIALSKHKGLLKSGRTVFLSSYMYWKIGERIRLMKYPMVCKVQPMAFINELAMSLNIERNRKH